MIRLRKIRRHMIHFRENLSNIAVVSCAVALASWEYIYCRWTNSPLFWFWLGSLKNKQTDKQQLFEIEKEQKIILSSKMWGGGEIVYDEFQSACFLAPCQVQAKERASRLQTKDVQTRFLLRHFRVSAQTSVGYFVWWVVTHVFHVSSVPCIFLESY